MRFDAGLRPGLAFMTLHFPDQVATNELTIDAVDPQSGTSEFKATAMRIEPVGQPAPGLDGTRLTTTNGSALHGRRADPEETEAVDALSRRLCPRTGDRRQYLLPVLHAIQDRKGWISPGALNYACRRLEVPPAEAFGVADF